MLAHQRRARILAELRRAGAVGVAELTVLLEVSDMTVRRDLDRLAADGLARKVHGGAVLVGQAGLDPGLAVESRPAAAAERAIAERAASLIRPGAAIGLSAGTTTWALARRIAGAPGITVLTNSTAVADVLSGTGAGGHNGVILTGGLRTQSAALVGPVADRAIAGLHVDQLFLGVHGMDGRAGFTTPTLAEAGTDQAFVAAAEEVVVLADSSRWGVIGLAEIGPLRTASVLVTDDRLVPEARRALVDAIPCVVLAGSGLPGRAGPG